MPKAARPDDATAHGDPLAPGPGSTNVTTNGKNQWRADVDSHVCSHPPSDATEICKLGSLTVTVNNKMAVRVDDFLTGAGAPNTITTGAATVLIGDIPQGLWANWAAFCRAMCELMRNWASLTPAQRQAGLSQAINASLARSGVPQVGINPTTFGNPNTQGQLDFHNWNLDINQNLLNSSALTEAQMQDLGNKILHEARHAEQWFAIAQHQAGQGSTAAEIAVNTGIPQSVANAAAANPAAADSYIDTFGGAMNQSVYGADGAYRNGVLNGLNNSPTAQGYDQYRALPEERDAWRTGDMMNGCTCK